MKPIFLWLLLAQFGQLAAEKVVNPKETGDEILRATVASAAKEFVGRCEFSSGAISASTFTPHPEPILRWSNPTVGQVFGEVYVWTDNGRPAVIASWYRWFSPDWGRTLEVCSLVDGRMTGRANDIEFWNTAETGLALKPLAEADVPAKTPAARLAQMRRLAGDFVAHLADTRGDDSGVTRQLRRLTHPVFRYPIANERATYLDGALFAFVEGTDPEAFLVLEATKAGDSVKWEYGLVRMNSDALRVTYRDQTVWTVSKLKDPLNLSKEPYALITSERVLKEPVASEKKAAPTLEDKP